MIHHGTDPPRPSSGLTIRLWRSEEKSRKRAKSPVSLKALHGFLLPALFTAAALILIYLHTYTRLSTT